MTTALARALEMAQKEERGARTRTKKLEKNFEALRERVLAGETTGDAAKDYLIAGNVPLADEEKAGAVRDLVARLGRHRGELFLVVLTGKEQHAFSVIPRYRDDDYHDVTEHWLGVVEPLERFVRREDSPIAWQVGTRAVSDKASRSAESMPSPIVYEPCLLQKVMDASYLHDRHRLLIGDEEVTGYFLERRPLDFVRLWTKLGHAPKTIHPDIASELERFEKDTLERARDGANIAVVAVKAAREAAVKALTKHAQPLRELGIRNEALEGLIDFYTDHS